jgi:hypothetical protein
VSRGRELPNWLLSVVVLKSEADVELAWLIGRGVEKGENDSRLSEKLHVGNL